jgi:hypothetical protein
MPCPCPALPALSCPTLPILSSRAVPKPPAPCLPRRAGSEPDHTNSSLSLPRLPCPAESYLAIPERAGPALPHQPLSRTSELTNPRLCPPARPRLVTPRHALSYLTINTARRACLLCRFFLTPNLSQLLEHGRKILIESQHDRDLFGPQNTSFDSGQFVIKRIKGILAVALN